ncbi:Gfo/Idh/MocA family protein [Magnetospirillum aberrantis]|uniref:Gfo/Idh/MocA family oxidoreductase n=1 Tax=Magnetospirillum aberrantis SpK TaxID=908842 RepID=A0A7C9QVF9_9PROT|nr:Gfo/Idh/MocA family oxidoreductase [Magnetospirillum aberrantis]NFV81544.1 Gfo/Idh/MocA family oxidoreductase [Magnetospirillum aberrantis SpK]
MSANGEKLRVGIAGYGVVGKRRRTVIDQHPALVTVAVADRTFSADGVLPDGVRHYANSHDLLAQEDLDILFVCLTNDVAAEVTIAGLEKGLHVFCEKPPGRDVKDIADVIAAEARHPGLKLKYGFNHRYHDSVRDALALVRSGQLGRIIDMRGVYGKSAIISFGQSDWRSKREIAGGGILLDQGIHMVDLMRLFAGEFSDVQAVVSNRFWGHDVEDNAYALMRTADGVVAMLHSSATQWRHRFQLDIALEKGAIILSGILSGSKSYGVETLTVAWATEGDAGDPREQTTRYNHDPSWSDEVADFADCILSGRPVSEGSSAEAEATMRLVYRIYCADPDWRQRWSLSLSERG